MQEQKQHKQVLAALDDPKTRKMVLEKTAPFRELMSFYRCAIMEAETKFRVLSEEYSLLHDRNPIESIKTRLKSPESIAEKMEKLGLPVSAETIEANLRDVAGIRVVCGFLNDVYSVAEAFLKQDDVTLIERKDYIKDPKPGGYRSLHLIVEIPIFLHSAKKPMKVEVQLRTLSMDWWASLEHRIRYKKDIQESDEIVRDLLLCAQVAAMLDEKMEAVQQKLCPAEEVYCLLEEAEQTGPEPLDLPSDLPEDE